MPRFLYINTFEYYVANKNNNYENNINDGKFKNKKVIVLESLLFHTSQNVEINVFQETRTMLYSSDRRIRMKDEN